VPLQEKSQSRTVWCRVLREDAVEQAQILVNKYGSLITIALYLRDLEAHDHSWLIATALNGLNTGKSILAPGYEFAR